MFAFLVEPLRLKTVFDYFMSVFKMLVELGKYSQTYIILHFGNFTRRDQIEKTTVVIVSTCIY